MRRTTILALLAVPLAIAGLFWLMLHGYLELSAYLLAAAVLGLTAAAVWEWRRGHPRWAAVLLVGALGTSAIVGSYGWNLNRKLDNIQRARDEVLDQGKRPADRPTSDLNILLMGADDPQQLVDKPTVAELLADGEWDPGAYRSDSLMVVHISADRKSAYVVSIPRDSYVKIYDEVGEAQGRNKVNAAFSAYGPFGTWRTVENLTGLRMDHMAIIDFKGFRDLTSAIGGVDVYVPQEVYDSKQDVTWEEGWVHLEDDLALKYVRMRHGLIEGDFDRVARQQNFLRAVMDKVLADDTIGNPMKFPATLEAITSNLTVDEGWTSGDIRRLALGLRGLSTRDVEFITLPFARYETVDGAGSVNIIARRRAAQLWEAIGADTVDDYLREHPEDELPPEQKVS